MLLSTLARQMQRAPETFAKAVFTNAVLRQSGRSSKLPRAPSPVHLGLLAAEHRTVPHFGTRAAQDISRRIPDSVHAIHD